MCTFTRAVFHKTVYQTFLITFFDPVKYLTEFDHRLQPHEFFIPMFSLSLARKQPVRVVSEAIFNALLQDSANFRFHHFRGGHVDEACELDPP